MAEGGERHCPICGDPIPATAHRLKKLCGKRSCMLEQQRISSRKSYHKVLGHTEPEKRSCVVCGDDISHLRGNRVVCEKPECKNEIKRRSGYAYFARNNDDPTVKERNRLNQQKYRAAKPKKDRRCQVCRDPINHLPPGSTICEKRSCYDYREHLRDQARRQRTKAPKPPRAPKPARPTINKNYQRKPKEHMKPYIAGKKKIVKPVVHEDEAWTPRTFNIPTEMPQHVPLSDRPTSTFADPWNCQACRNDSQLCRLHQSMEDSGSKPPMVKSTYNV